MRQGSSGSYDVGEQISGNVSIHSTERIVQQVEVGIVVDGSCQTHSLLLPTAQIHPLPKNEHYSFIRNPDYSPSFLSSVSDGKPYIITGV